MSIFQSASITPSREELEITTTNDHHTSPFLALPAELRNQIYLYVFGGRTIVMQRDRLNTSTTGVTGKIHPIIHNDRVYNAAETSYLGRHNHVFALLKTCRQIHNETYTLPFSLNTFSISYDSALNIWAKEHAIATRLRLIRTIRLDLFKMSPLFIYGGFAELVKSLAHLTRPEVVEVSSYQPSPWEEHDEQQARIAEMCVKRVIHHVLGNGVEVRVMRR